MNLSSKACTFCSENGYEFTKDTFAFEGNYYIKKLLFGVWKNSLLFKNSLKCFSISPGTAYTMSEKAAGTD